MIVNTLEVDAAVSWRVKGWKEIDNDFFKGAIEGYAKAVQDILGNEASEKLLLEIKGCRYGFFTSSDNYC